MDKLQLKLAVKEALVMELWSELDAQRWLATRKRPAVKKKPEVSHLVLVREWGGKFQVNEVYRLIADALKKKFPEELVYTPVARTLFIDIKEGRPVVKGRTKYSEIGKIPERWSQVITQLANKRFDYFLALYRENIEEMSQAQVVAEIYSQLRRVDSEGNIVDPEIIEWSEVLRGLGPGWRETKSQIPDILDENIDWDSIQRPNLFRPLRAVK